MALDEREALNELECEPPKTNDELSHFMCCPTCGQTFDMRNLGDVLHHDQPDHQPLLVH